MPAIAQGVVKDLWNRAVQEKAGLKIRVDSKSKATTLKHRLNSVRAKARRALADQTHQVIETVELPWDSFAVSVKPDPNPEIWWVHIEPDTLFFSNIEIQTLSGKKIDMGEDPFDQENGA